MENVTLQAEEARLLYQFLTSFTEKHPEVGFARVDDCWLFRRQKDAALFVDELEKFLEEVGGD